MNRRQILISGALLAPAYGIAQMLNQYAEGRDFYEIKYRVTPPHSSKKTSVACFMSAEIAECVSLLPQLAVWMKNHPDVQVTLVHVSAGGMHAVAQRLMACAEVLGLGFEAVAAVYANIRSGQHLQSRDDALALAKRAKLDAAKIASVWDSDLVNAQVRRYDRMTLSYRVRSAPSFGVSDRYFVPARKENILSVLDKAIEQSKTPKKEWGVSAPTQFISAPSFGR